MVAKIKYFISDYRKVVFASIAGLMMVLFAFLFFILPNTLSSTDVKESVFFESKKLSYSDGEPGAWRVTKTSEWLERDKVKITFDIDSIVESKRQNVDLVLLLDTSASMVNEKINKVKEDTKNLLEIVLKDENNRASIITFNSTSSILSRFTNSLEDIKRNIDYMSVTGQTNYYQALVNLRAILKNYKKEDNRDLVVLFITDGYPNIDTPNEVSEYETLKEEYPFMIFNAIQYEMGEKVADQVSKISDKQYVADIESLYNVLYDAAGIGNAFDNFEITDYVNDEYFSDIVEKSIEVSKGDVEVFGNSIKWKFGDLLITGMKASMSFEVSLKPEYTMQPSLIKTNSKTITSSQLGSIEENVDSNESPVLANNYKVIYDANLPEGCKVDNVPTTKNYNIFDTVELSKEDLQCDNYRFVGWELIDDDIEKVNDEYFIMPTKEVVIRGTWSAFSLAKSVDGKVAEVQTLYGMMKNNSVIDNISSEYVSAESGINFKVNSSDTNGKGIYMLSSTKDDEYPVYYYRGNIENNNIIYANHCWKIVRTTSSGGVKIIYNGAPDSQGNCNNSGSSTVIGSTPFNNSTNTLALLGYMYGTVEYSIKSLEKQRFIMYNTKAINANFYFADNVTYDVENKSYSLVDPYKISGENDFKEVVGKYTLFANNIDNSDNSVKYIVALKGTTMYYINIDESSFKISQDVNDYVYTMYFSKDIEKNADGTYSLVNPEQVRVTDWINVYGNFNDYYTCGNASITCDLPYGVHSTITYIDILPVEIIIGNKFDYIDGKYILDDTAIVKNWHELTQFSNRHYTCLNDSGTCKELKFINVGSTSYAFNYVLLTNGESILDALSKIHENNFDSKAKEMVDKWYENNILNSEFENYLEDTIYCNDRRVSENNFSASRYNPNGGSITTDLTYYSVYNYTTTDDYIPDLSCEKADSFTTSSDIGNGKLKYPIGLLTFQESIMSGAIHGRAKENSYLNNETDWWTMTPESGSPSNTTEVNYYHLGYVVNYNATVSATVRPAVSLKPGLKIALGDGTPNNPYILD